MDLKSATQTEDRSKEKLDGSCNSTGRSQPRCAVADINGSSAEGQLGLRSDDSNETMGDDGNQIMSG